MLVTRKIGYPPQPELGVGAIAEGGARVYDRAVLAALRLAPADLSDVAEREYAELARRVEVYRGGQPPPDVAGRSVIVVDDGLATGVTARAALRAVRAGRAARTILAVPVAPAASVAAMRAEADEVVVLASPRHFRSVGKWCVAFGQLSDADVLSLLAQAAARPPLTPPPDAPPSRRPRRPRARLGCRGQKKIRAASRNAAARMGLSVCCCRALTGRRQAALARPRPAPALAPVLLVQPAPDAVLLRPGQRVIEALNADRALGAHRLGLPLPDVALRLALTVRPEEKDKILLAARSSILPAPVGPGKHSRLPTHLRHGTNHL